MPTFVTCLFVLILAVLLAFRLHDRAIVSQVLSQNSSSGRDYAALLSHDKVDEFDSSAVDVNEPADSTSVKSAANTSTTFKSGVGAATPTSSSTATSSTPQASTPASSGGTNTSASPAQTQPFTATISNMRQEKDATQACTNGSGSKASNCTKTYYFVADVASQNGPGKVDYKWIFSVNGSSNGSYQAGTGGTVNTLHTQISISCQTSTIFSAQFALTSPAATQSSTLRVLHFCSL